jgi:hypothetical protein
VKARYVLGGLLCVVGAILVVTAILALVQTGTCGGDGAPPCPPTINVAVGELIGGILLVVIGSIMTVAVGLLIFLLVGAVYAIVRVFVDSSSATGSDLIVAAVFLAIPLLLAVIGFIIEGRRRRREAAMARFKEIAQRADGVIAAVNDTGVTINENPQVRLIVNYQRPDHIAAQAEKKLVVPRLSIPRPGQPVIVWYDPSGSEAIVEFDPAAPAEPGVDALLDVPADRVTSLERLAALHRDGSLTDEEFTRAKTQLLHDEQIG